MKIDLEKVKIEVVNSYSYNELSKKYFGYVNTKRIKILKDVIISHNINTSHFDSRKRQRKYEIIEKVCPICMKKFNVKKNHKKEKITCSCKCSNTYFRSGENNGQYKNGIHAYRNLCFKIHGHKCLLCDETKILDAHHLDKNTKNNTKENLVPLCPTHHRYLHSKYAKEVLEKLKNILEKKS